MTIPWALTFPDLFEQTDVASTTWGLLSTVWHVGFPLFVIAYALLKGDEPATRRLGRSLSFAVVAGAAGVVIVDVLMFLVTAANETMPSTLPVFERSYIYWNSLLLLAFIALSLLWARRHSVLDLWLMVVMCGFLIEVCLIFLVGRRYVVGWYAARVYLLISSTLVLAILLSETALLYRRLARSVIRRNTFP